MRLDSRHSARRFGCCQGVSMGAVVRQLGVGARADIRPHIQTWFVAAYTSPVWTIWAVFGAGLALLTAWKRPEPGGLDWQGLLHVKAAIMAMVWQRSCLRPMLRSKFAFDMSIMPLVTPFAWMVLFHPDQGEQQAQAFPRALLCAVTTMQALYGYPVMGSQRQFMECLLLVLLLVCMHDSFSWLTRFGTRPDWFARRSHARLRWPDWRAYRTAEHRSRLGALPCNYPALPALDLHGARLLRTCSRS